MSGIVRIKDLDTASELTSGDYLAVDSATDGLRKVPLKPITDDISDLKSALNNSNIFDIDQNKKIRQLLMAKDNIGIDNTGNVEVFEKLITPTETVPYSLYNYSNNQASPITAGYGCYKKYTVLPGETYYLTGRHFYTDLPFYILLNGSGGVVDHYDGGTQGHNVDNYKLTIPNNAVTLIVNGHLKYKEKIAVTQTPEIPQQAVYDGLIALKSGSTTQYEILESESGYAKCVRFSIDPSIGYCLVGGRHYYTDRPLYMVTDSSGTVLKFYDGGPIGDDSAICCFGVPASSAYLYVNVSKNYVKTVKLYKYSSFDTLNGYVNTKIYNSVAQYAGEKFVTPQMFGAKGNGTIDDILAIQRAIEAAKGGTVFFPKGTYAITSPIKTYKNNSNYTNLVFDNDAIIVAISQTPYLLELGVLGNDTRVGHVRKVLRGGYFDGSNGNVTTAIVRISSGCMTLDMSDFQINANGCDGLQVGDSGSPSSIDANIHNGFIRNTGASSSNSGIKIFGTDNNFSDLRIYSFQKQVEVLVDSQFFNDIHTLSKNSSTPTTTSLYIHDDAHVQCTNFYGDSEDTFVYMGNNSTLVGNNLYYYSYRTNSVTVFDVHNNPKIFVYGFHLNIKDYNYIGFKLSSGNLSKAISRENFLITGMDIEGANYLKNGDPLKCMMTSDGQPLFNATSLQANSWYHVCAYPADSSTKHWFKLFNGPESTLIPLNVKYAGSALVDTLLLSAVESNSTGVFDVGFALLNTSSGYALINVYIRASAAMDIDGFSVCSKYAVGGSTSNQQPDVSLSSSSVTPTIVYRVDCVQKTITKLV